MQFNKHSQRWMLALMSAWFGLLLVSACTDDKVTRMIPDTPNEVLQWLQAELQEERVTQTPPEMNRLNEQLSSSDRRLMRTADGTTLIADHVFLAVNDTAADKAATPPKNTARVEAAHATPPSLSKNVSDALLLGMQYPTSSKTEIQKASEDEPDLSQAGAQQIKYIGLMQAGADTYGLVRVGSRVYRVVPDMRIGRGQWLVLKIDATQMQVLINGKTVHYGK